MVDLVRVYVAALALFEIVPAYEALVLGKTPYFVPDGGSQLFAGFTLLLSSTRLGAAIADDFGSRLTLAITHIGEAAFFALQSPREADERMIQIATFANAALFAWHATRVPTHRKHE